MEKLAILFDGDELVCDIKALCTKPIETIGINYINHSRGRALISEGSLVDSYTHDEIVVMTDRLIQQRINIIKSNFPHATPDKMFIALSMRDNFRKHISPSYKKKTNKKFNSFLNPDIRQHLIDRYGVYDETTNPSAQILIEHEMEADDKIGIAATSLGSDIIVISSQDKDMQTIPNAWLHNPNTDELQYVDDRQATDYFLMQLLMGDRADGVDGLKGYGNVSAKNYISSRRERGYTPYQIYREIEGEYYSAGRVDDCVKNARLLRILTRGCYDFDNRTIKLIDENYFSTLA